MNLTDKCSSEGGWEGGGRLPWWWILVPRCHLAQLPSGNFPWRHCCCNFPEVKLVKPVILLEHLTSTVESANVSEWCVGCGRWTLGWNCPTRIAHWHILASIIADVRTTNVWFFGNEVWCLSIFVGVTPQPIQISGGDEDRRRQVHGEVGRSWWRPWGIWGWPQGTFFRGPGMKHSESAVQVGNGNQLFKDLDEIYMIYSTISTFIL